MAIIYRVCSSLCGLLALLAWLPGCDPAAHSVSEIQIHPENFSGQRVLVRGWAHFDYIVAGVGCSAQNKCCNSGQGILTLSADPISDEKAPAPGIDVQDFSCIKDQCNAVCSPVDPTALAFELTGVLKQVSGPVPIYRPSVALYDIDWSASSQLAGSGDLFDLQKIPLNTGTFIVPNVNN